MKQTSSQCGAADLTNLVTVTKTGFAWIPNANWVNGTITIKNTSSVTIPGPINLVLNGIPRGSGKDAVDVMHNGPIPTTRCYSSVPDYVFPMTPGQFNPGQTLTLNLSIVLPSYIPSPSFQTYVLSGALNK